MVAGVVVMALLGGVVLAVVVLALAAGWWVTHGRADRVPEVQEAGAGALVVSTDTPTNLTTSAVAEAAGPAPGLGQVADQRLRELDDLLAQGLIDQEEYTATRAAILGTL